MFGVGFSPQGRDNFLRVRDYFLRVQDVFLEVRDFFLRVQDLFGGVQDFFFRVRDFDYEIILFSHHRGQNPAHLWPLAYRGQLQRGGEGGDTKAILLSCVPSVMMAVIMVHHHLGQQTGSQRGILVKLLPFKQ